MTRLPFTAAIAAVALIPGAAVAQDPDASVSAESQSRSGGWIPQIVVTGTADRYNVENASVLRAPVALQDTPQSVQVLTRQLLDDQEVITLDEALVNISGVVPSLPSEIVLANPVVRGFEAEIFIDGLIGYADTAVLDLSSLWNVEQVEVAKGPTSTLFGGGTGAPVGGLINLVSKAPQPENAFSARLRGGSFDSYSAAADANIALGDTVAVRLIGEVQTFADTIDAVDGTRVLAAPSVRFTPGAGTDIVGRFTYSRVAHLEYAGLPALFRDNPQIEPDRFTGATIAPDTQIENRIYDLAITQQLAGGVTANVKARRYESDFEEYSTSPFFAFFPCQGTVCPVINGILPASVREWTVDASLTAQISTGGIDHVALGGVQYDATDYDAGLGFDFFGAVPFDYADPDSDFAYSEPTIGSTISNQYRTLGVYVQDQLTIGDRLHILASLRYSRLELTELDGGNGADVTYHEWDPRIGISFQAAEGVNLFAGYATGSRLSLFFNGAEAPLPERSESYEAGVKLAPSDIGLSGTLAAFQIERTNVPTPDPDPEPENVGTSIQTGAQRSRGIELDAIYEPSRSFSLLVNYAYTDATILRDETLPVGDRLRRVPKHRGRLALRYRFGPGALDGLELGAGATYFGGAAIALPNVAQTDDYVIGDLQASYRIDALRIGLRIDNIANADYFVPYQYFAQDVVRPGNPRSAFVTLGIDL